MPAWMAFLSWTMASTVRVMSAPGNLSTSDFSPGITGMARCLVMKSA